MDLQYFMLLVMGRIAEINGILKNPYLPPNAKKNFEQLLEINNTFYNELKKLNITPMQYLQ